MNKTGNRKMKNQKNQTKTKMKYANKAERRDHYTRLARERSEHQNRRKKESNMICFHCRQRGHSLASCPSTVSAQQQQQQEQHQLQQHHGNTKICYKCGSTEHGLLNCPKRNVRPSTTEQGTGNGQSMEGIEVLPFATCFICHEQGHLAGTCPQNDHGVYVKGNGAACYYCGSKYHKASQCRNKKRVNGPSKAGIMDENGSIDDASYSELLDENVATNIPATDYKESTTMQVSTSELIDKSSKQPPNNKKRRFVKF